MSVNRKWLVRGLALALLAVAVIRAALGVAGGVAFARGTPLAWRGRLAEALPLLERGAIGESRFDALWLAAEVRLGLWDALNPRERRAPDGLALLQEARRGYLEAMAACPASGWPWAGLAQAYDRSQQVAHAIAPPDLGRVDLGPWAFVDREGRIALGLTRIAIEREPRLYQHRDQLVRQWLGYGLRDEARVALRESAAIQPLFDAHQTLGLEDLAPELIGEFADASEAALGQTPLLSRERHLMALARLRYRLREFDAAERAVRRALDEPAAELERAEQAYWLAQILVELGREGEAAPYLETAAREPVFGPGLAVLRAGIAERAGRLEEALADLAEARRLDPGNLSVVMRYARIAHRLGQPSRVDEALDWAEITHPGSLTPYLERAEYAIASGELLDARRSLDAAAAIDPQSPAVARLRAAWEEARERAASGGGALDRIGIAP